MKIELEHPNGFILEHPTRGTLQHIEWDPFRTPPRWVPVFAWASPRSNAQLFTSLGAAEETRTKLPEGQLRDRTRILAFGTWKEVG